MKNKLLAKIGMIALLSLLLLIPLMMVGGKVSERQRYYNHAEREISRMWTGEQALKGPVVIVPYTETKIVTVWDKDKEKNIKKEKVISSKKYFFPEQLDVKMNVKTQERTRGVYAVPVYTSTVKMTGQFVIPANFGVSSSRNILWQQAYVAYSVSDTRGIQASSLLWQDRKKIFLPGTKTPKLMYGAHVRAGNLQAAIQKKYSFAIDISLAGTKNLNIIPVGKNTHVEMTSNWQHPSFTGRFLPVTRNISDSGFSANWKVSHFAANSKYAFDQCRANDCRTFEKNYFGVSFVKPVSIYNLTDRAIKYGVLFILLTFSVFFLLEVMKNLSIHPVQYTLVGLSLVVFYQLLLALSEHLYFDIAYLISAISSASLISFYLSYALKSALRGLIFGASLFVLYIMLLVILKSEDFALLMGSALVFIALATFMLLTKNIDWYQVSVANKSIQKQE